MCRKIQTGFMNGPGVQSVPSDDQLISAMIDKKLFFNNSVMERYIGYLSFLSLCLLSQDHTCFVDISLSALCVG
jgi:hypothetical protein